MKYLLSILLLCSVLIAVDDKTLIQENGTFVIVDKSLSTPVPENNTSPVSVQCAIPDYGPAVDVKTLGLKGNGSDEKTLLGTILNKGGTYLFKDIAVSIGGSVNISQAVNVKMIFDNAKITMLTNASSRKSMIYAEPTVKHIEVQGGTFDGNGVAMSGLYFNTSYYIHDATVQNMSSKIGDNDYSVGIYSRILTNDSCIEIANNTIKDIHGKSNNYITDHQGASKGVAIAWLSATRAKVEAYIHDNTIDHIYGEEGGGIFVYDLEAYKQVLTSRVEIRNNTISDCNRRMIKAQSGNMLIDNNTFTTYRFGDSEAINSTAMLTIMKGGKDIQVSNNKFTNNGHHRQLISLHDLDNVLVSQNTFYSRRNGAPESIGQALEILGTTKNVTFRDNTLDTDGYTIVWMPTDLSGNINVVDNSMIVNTGNKHFALLTKKYNGLHFENNIIDGSQGTGITGSLQSFLTAYNPAKLTNAKFIGNKILPGSKKVNNGRFATFTSTQTQGSITFQGNYTEGSDTKYQLVNTANIRILD